MNEKILIIDDEKDILTLLDSTLTNEGFQVQSTLRGEEAIKIFKSEPFDLVITDIRMPRMDGLEVMRQIKKIDEDMEIIILTGHATLENAIHALKDDGAYDYLRKPLEDIEEFLISVRNALERSRFRKENKRLVTELRESEEKYRSMMESMKDAVYICSLDFRIEYLNPAMVSRINHDATGELCHQAIYGSDEKCSWCVFDQIHKGEHVDCEVADPKNNNYYSTSNSPIHHSDGSISKLTIARDITRVKKIEKQLQQSQKMEAIGSLAGGIAHQFNNALSVMTGNIDLLETDFPSDENVAYYAKEMKASAGRMTQLTAQMLAYAKGGRYQAKTVSLNDFVIETLPLVKHTVDSTINIDTDLPSDILNVKADLIQLQMVLSAVLANASEAMEGKGHIRIACRNEIITGENASDFPELKAGNYISLTITDDGKGMDEETRIRIFEPFFTTKFDGPGLGMAAAYGIVKNHDGWISVDSELGQGTIVKIYLPAVETPVKEDAKPKPKTEWINGTGTILVIDDEESVMKVTRKILEKLGYLVLMAKTGQEAIDVVKTFDGDIDLAMLDILLPDMNGNTIYPLLMEFRPNLKVIVFSGYSIDGPVREILDAGAEDFIQKPFRIAELSEKLKKTLGNEQSSSN